MLYLTFVNINIIIKFILEICHAGDYPIFGIIIRMFNNDQIRQ